MLNRATKTILIMILFSSLIGCTQHRWVVVPAPTYQPIDEVVFAYSDIAFLMQDGTFSNVAIAPHYLMKYGIPLSYSLQTQDKQSFEQWAPVVAKHLTTLANITGRSTSLVDLKSAAIVIRIGDKSELKQIPRHFGASNKKYCWSSEFAYSRKKALSFDIDSIAIAIDSENLKKSNIEKCILLTITRPLGFIPNDTVFRSSIWSKKPSFRTSNLPENLDYTSVEKMIIKGHFDPRLQHGMLREKALPIFRKIIIELWPEFMGEPAPVN